MFDKFIKKLRRGEPETARETLEEIIEEPEEEDKSIQDDERQLLGNILNLRELTAEDVMLPRADIVAINDKMEAEEVIRVMVENGFSCLPIYKGDMDNVIATVHIKDIFAFLDKKKPLILHHLMKRNIRVISPSMRILDLLIDMRSSGNRMAIVSDEHGGTDGLVCFSDIIERIVGDIQDVYHAEPQLIEIKKNGMIIIDARITLEELEEELSIDLKVNESLDEEVDTLGGLIASIINRVPVTGELISYLGRYEFHILDADLRRIKKVSIKKIEQSAEAHD